MNIRTKLILGLLAVLIVNLGVGGYAFWIHRTQYEKAARLCAHFFRIVETSLSAQVHFKKQVQEWKNVLLRGHEPKFYEKYLNQFHQEESATRELIETLIPMIAAHPAIQQHAKAFLIAHIRLGREYREALKHYSVDEGSPYIAVDQRVRGIDRQPTDLLDEVVLLAHELRDQQITALRSVIARAEKQILFTMMGTLIGSLVFAIWLIDRRVGKPIEAATKIARKIALGDFSSEITIPGQDEATQMLQALKKMQTSLEEFRNSLRKSEEQTRLLLNSSGEGIYGVNTAGQCTFCNPAALNLLGYSGDATLLCNDVHALVHHTYPDGRPYPPERCKASQTYRTGEPAHVDDEVFWRADGSCFAVEYRSFPIYHDQNLVGAVVSFADISERKRAEENLKAAHAALANERAALAQRVTERTEQLRIANAELARSARAKDEFLAAMSHELRTPLTAILGNTEILLSQSHGSEQGLQPKALKTIEESANHLLALINDILDVAKVEAGKMNLTWDLVPVKQICEASLRLIRQSAERKALNVSSRIDPQVQIITGDGRRLKQLLVNLLSNAVKFTPQGGAVGLDLEGIPSAGRVRFTVWDTGIGIDSNQQDQLFKPFIQLDSKLSRQYRGTGLGLTLVRRMAELHGGTVSVDSAPGQGSRFHVLLPWDPSPTASPPSEGPHRLTGMPGTSASDASNQLRLLLAEDDTAILDMLSHFLNNAGYTVISAQNGEEAVDKAWRERPDIILMDIQMPKLDGLQAIARLRAHTAFDKTPVIALTALAMPGDRERCLEAGADDYLGKPVGLKELHQRIQSWAQRICKE